MFGAERPISAISSWAESTALPISAAGDPESLRGIARRTRVVVSTVGPCTVHGDLLVHACGFDNIFYDLGVLVTGGHLPQDRPIHVDGFIRADGLPPAAHWPAR